jgi:hypothetical protein
VAQPGLDEPVVVRARKPGREPRIRQHREARRLVRVRQRERDVEPIEHMTAQLIEREAREHRARLDGLGVVRIPPDPAGGVHPGIRRHAQPGHPGALDQLTGVGVGKRHELLDRAVRDVDIAIDEHAL